MLRRALSDIHDVRTATDARTALGYITAGERFDLIVCDLLMPRMRGMDLHAELVSRDDGTAERMIFMTGGAFTPRASEFLANVKNPKLTKPFDLGAFERMIAENLARLG
jgi:CheY-like chemotaxis protein